jgi:hypothetical protein
MNKIIFYCNMLLDHGRVLEWVIWLPFIAPNMKKNVMQMPQIQKLFFSSSQVLVLKIPMIVAEF